MQREGKERVGSTLDAVLATRLTQFVTLDALFWDQKIASSVFAQVDEVALFALLS